ncbi:EexN family lipoprotein [Roseobacter litoralis]|uniref:EexN family lipoprotein n=1 Tax=Roseobacter litoralis TaxID=42443 RepID=UPI002493EDC0|nr:EexN family lipoprotein [Roseobacter litoralis]
MGKLISTMKIGALLLMVSGCKDDGPNKTVEYYLSNAKERASVSKNCETMDNAATEANCINAQKAEEVQATEKNRENRSDAVNSLFGTGG